MKKAGALLFSALFAISEVLSGSAQAAPEYTLSLNLPIPPIFRGSSQPPLRSI